MLALLSGASQARGRARRSRYGRRGPPWSGGSGWGRLRAAGPRASASRAVQALGALAAELEAGQSPREALLRAGGEPCVWPVARGALRMDGDVAGALLVDAQRHPPLRHLAACWEVAAASGAGLAAAVVRLAAGERAAEDVRVDLEGQLAGPRATARLLSLLPLVGIGVGMLLGSDPLAWLLTTGPGRRLPAGRPGADRRRNVVDRAHRGAGGAPAVTALAVLLVMASAWLMAGPPPEARAAPHDRQSRADAVARRLRPPSCRGAPGRWPLSARGCWSGESAAWCSRRAPRGRPSPHRTTRVSRVASSTRGARAAGSAGGRPAGRDARGRRSDASGTRGHGSGDRRSVARGPASGAHGPGPGRGAGRGLAVRPPTSRRCDR